MRDRFPEATSPTPDPDTSCFFVADVLEVRRRSRVELGSLEVDDVVRLGEVPGEKEKQTLIKKTQYEILNESIKSKISNSPEVVFDLLLSKLVALVPTARLVLVTALLDAGLPPAIAARRSSLLFT